MNRLHPLALSLCLLLTGLLGGCGDLTGRGAAPLETTIDPALRAQHQRVGYVYCMRGFLGIFSEGMDSLAGKIDKDIGASAVSVANEERWRLRDWIIANRAQFNDGPLVLLGHSYGADDMIRVAEFLKQENISVDLLILIDPVTPPKVSTNVKRVYCVYKSNPVTDWYPAWRGVPADVVDPKATPLTNIDLRITDVGFDTTQLVHPTIDKSEGVHNLCIEEIKKVCLTRDAWAKLHATPAKVSAAQTAPPGTITKPLSATP